MTTKNAITMRKLRAERKEAGLIPVEVYIPDTTEARKKLKKYVESNLGGICNVRIDE